MDITSSLVFIIMFSLALLGFIANVLLCKC